MASSGYKDLRPSPQSGKDTRCNGH